MPGVQTNEQLNEQLTALGYTKGTPEYTAAAQALFRGKTVAPYNASQAAAHKRTVGRQVQARNVANKRKNDWEALPYDQKIAQLEEWRTKGAAGDFDAVKQLQQTLQDLNYNIDFKGKSGKMITGDLARDGRLGQATLKALDTYMKTLELMHNGGKEGVYDYAGGVAGQPKSTAYSAGLQKYYDRLQSDSSIKVPTMYEAYLQSRNTPQVIEGGGLDRLNRALENVDAESIQRLNRAQSNAMTIATVPMDLLLNVAGGLVRPVINGALTGAEYGISPTSAGGVVTSAPLEEPLKKREYRLPNIEKQNGWYVQTGTRFGDVITDNPMAAGLLDMGLLTALGGVKSYRQKTSGPNTMQAKGVKALSRGPQAGVHVSNGKVRTVGFLNSDGTAAEIMYDGKLPGKGPRIGERLANTKKAVKNQANLKQRYQPVANNPDVALYEDRLGTIADGVHPKTYLNKDALGRFTNVPLATRISYNLGSAWQRPLVAVGPSTARPWEVAPDVSIITQPTISYEYVDNPNGSGSMLVGNDEYKIRITPNRWGGDDSQGTIPIYYGTIGLQQ